MNKKTEQISTPIANQAATIIRLENRVEELEQRVSRLEQKGEKRRAKHVHNLYEMDQNEREWLAYLSGTRKDPPEGQEPLTPEERKQIYDEMAEMTRFDFSPDFKPLRPIQPPRPTKEELEEQSRALRESMEECRRDPELYREMAEMSKFDAPKFPSFSEEKETDVNPGQP